MNMVKGTKKFEDWLGLHIRIIGADLRFKHEQMASGLFPFFRATFYRWLQVWPEACADLDRAPAEILYGAILKRSVRCPDPYVQMRAHWIVRRLSPHCSRIDLETLGTSRGELRLLEAMGAETANVHLGTVEKRKAILKDLRGRKGSWLVGAAQAMLEAMEKDWRVWTGRRRS
jgi:hypothetical protein